MVKIIPSFYKVVGKTIFFEDMLPWDSGEISKILYDLGKPHDGIQHYEYIMFPDHIVEVTGWGGASYIYLEIYSKESGEGYWDFKRHILEKSIIIHRLDYKDKLGKLLQGKLKVKKHNT